MTKTRNLRAQRGKMCRIKKSRNCLIKKKKKKIRTYGIISSGEKTILFYYKLYNTSKLHYITFCSLKIKMFYVFLLFYYNFFPRYRPKREITFFFLVKYVV